MTPNPEDPLLKIRRVEMDYLDPEVFEHVKYERDEGASVKEMGGIMTSKDTTYYDPLYVLGADDRVLAFTLAHERNHWGEDPTTEGGKSEREADEFALNLLRKCDWTRTDVEKVVFEWGAHILWYFKETRQGEPDSVEGNVGRLLALCEKIWGQPA